MHISVEVMIQLMIVILLPFFTLAYWLGLKLIRQRRTRMILAEQRFQAMQEYGYDLARIRQANPLLVAHIRQLAASEGIHAAITYATELTPLPEDIVQVLVRSEACALGIHQDQQPHPSPRPASGRPPHPATASWHNQRQRPPRPPSSENVAAQCQPFSGSPP